MVDWLPFSTHLFPYIGSSVNNHSFFDATELKRNFSLALIKKIIMVKNLLSDTGKSNVKMGHCSYGVKNNK